MAITTPLFDMFGRSPIKPMQRHMEKSHAAAVRLIPFIEAVYAEQWDKAKEIQHEIGEYERAADELKRDLRLNLPKGFLLPVPRTDILELLATQDRIANKAEDIAGLIIGRRMKIPEKLKAEYKLFLQRCVDASEQAKQAIGELDELLETGFGGSEADVVENMIHQLDAIEHDSDKMQIDLREKLFQMEGELPPIEVMFLYKLFERTGDLADRAQTVGGRLQLLLAR